MNESQSIQYFIYMFIGLWLRHYQFLVAVFFIALDAVIQIKVTTFIVSSFMERFTDPAEFQSHTSPLQILLNRCFPQLSWQPSSYVNKFGENIYSSHQSRSFVRCFPMLCKTHLPRVLIALPFFSMVNPIKDKNTDIFPNVSHTSTKRYFNMKPRC